MMETIKAAIEFIESRDWLVAVIVGTLVATSLTQVLKMFVIERWPQYRRRSTWYLCTLLTGELATVAICQTALCAVLGLAVGGLLSPACYYAYRWILVKIAPEAKVSATPAE